MIYAALFDLDDTLYPERDYVRSGLAAVARVLTSSAASQAERLRDLIELFERDPERVFDRYLEMFPSTVWPDGSRVTAPQLVAVYRQHVPDIRLYEDVGPTLEELRRHKVRLGIVTDGRADGQRAKLDALGLGSLVDVIVFTDCLGPKRQYWKPHHRPFQIALDRLGVDPSAAVYVGDNPWKDFHGPALLGLRTVRIRRPNALRLFRRRPPEDGSERDADHIIHGLDDLLELLRQWKWIT